MNEILSNGLKSIIDLARTDHFKEAYSDAEKIVFLNRVTGLVSEIDKSKPATSHTLDNIDSLIQFIDQTDAMPGDEGFPRIFIQPTEIICILDYKGFRVHRLTVPLIQSPILRYLSQIGSLQMEPKEAVRSLKFNLHSVTITNNPIQALSDLKFFSSSSADHTTNVFDEGVSKSLQSKVSGATEIPEQFQVQFEMYPAISEELEKGGFVWVGMELHVDPTKGLLTFRPFPGSIDAAVLTAQREVQQTIFKKLIDADREPLSHLVFLGKP
jgi:hypothetical protein